MWWKILLLLGMSAMIVGSFLTPPPQAMIGSASRIFYYHIPQAWLCVIAFAMSMIYSIMYLKTRKIEHDDQAAIAAGIGFLFCLLATVTGAIFAKVTWGSYWNWDPRQTSVFVLLLIYAAYFALRGAVEIEEKRASLTAVYSIFAFVTVPFLIFVVPRVLPSLHPEDSIIDSNMKFTIRGTVALLFFSSLALFSVIYVWMFNLARRVQKLTRAREEQLND
jgi:heme exporter protein C